MIPAPPPSGPEIPKSRNQQLHAIAAMFGESEEQEHRDAAKRTADEYSRAFRITQEEARDAGLETHGTSALGRLFQAGHRHAEVWQRRVKALEKLLRDVLASDYATEEQRQALVGALCGRTAPGRDPKLLTETESALVAHYRAATQPDKMMLRALIVRLGEKGGAQ